MSLLNRLYKGSLIAFILFWIVFILIDYWQKHPLYGVNISNFSYLNLLFIWGLLGAAISWGVLWLKKQKKRQKYIRGGSIFGLSLVIMVVLIQTYFLKLDRPTLDGYNLGIFLGNMLYSSICLYLTVLISYVLGDLIMKPFVVSLTKLGAINVRIALGIVGLVGILFIVGLVSLLQWYILLPIFVAILGWRWRESLDFIKKTIINPIKLPKALNVLGIASFFVIIIMYSHNFMQVNMPFPRGWDAMSLYVKLPSLINDYNGLVAGYQPYNWSLFMSLGYVLFGKIEVVLCLSFLGGVLCLFGLYSIARSFLNMNINFSLLSAAIFYLIPSVGFQAVLDQKVDLGLLYILLCIVLVLLSWIEKITAPEEEAAAFSWKRLFTSEPHLVLMGILSGFALGIKLTTIFTILSVLAAIWYLLKGSWGFLMLFAFSIFGILLLKMDQTSGLRAYHLSANLIQWIFFVIGIGMLAYLFVKDRAMVLKGVRVSLIYLFCSILPFLPWLGKNISEAKGKISMTTLLNGASEKPKLNLTRYINSYKNQNK